MNLEYDAFSWLGPYAFSAAIEAIRDELVRVKPLIKPLLLDQMSIAAETASSKSGGATKVQVKRLQILS